MPDTSRDAPAPDAPAHRGLGRRLAHARVVGEAEVVVGAQQQHRPAVEQHGRPLRSADQPQAPARARAARARPGAPGSSFTRLPGGPPGRGWAHRPGAGTAPALGAEAQLRGGVPEAHRQRRRGSARRRRAERSSTTSGVSPDIQPRRLSGRGLAALSGWRATFRPELGEHLAVALGAVAEGRQEVAHHHAVDAGLDRQLLQLAEVLHAPPAEPEERVGEDQPEDRDPLDRLPRVHEVAVAELRAGARVEHVDRHAGGVDVRQLEGHLDALLAGLAEVEDAAHAGLQARLADRRDRAHAALVADRGGDLVVVAAGRLDVVVHALDAGLAQRRARSAEMWPTEAQRLRLVCSETSRTPSRYLVEVALGQPLALGDHAEAVGARRLGRASVFEDLLGLHHRVHRRLGVGEARLRAEAAVLGAAAGLGVHERAHVGRVARTAPRVPARPA